MKISIVCNSDQVALGTILHLQEQGMLDNVYLLEKNKMLIEPALIKAGIQSSKFVFLEKHTWEKQIHASLTKNATDMVWVFAFPWLIPSAIYQLPRKGFLNFHYGSLPKYKGADPIFWQIRNQEPAPELVVHQLTEDLDCGPVVFREVLPIMLGETCAMYCSRVGYTTPSFIPSILEAVDQGNYVAQTAQKNESPFTKRPTYEQLCINWDEFDADEIEALVNACNPNYGGASTMIKGQEVKVLEVTPADITDNKTTFRPGTVVHSDALYGLIVACKNDKFLRINIVSSREGYLSGVRLFALGVKVGDLFYNSQREQIYNESRLDDVPSLEYS